MDNPTQASAATDVDGELALSDPRGGLSRRTFLATGVAAGVGASLGPLGRSAVAFADRGFGLTRGDEAILRFLAAAEILEADLWQQYNELGGIQDSQVPGGSGSPPYVKALEVLDEDMSQYIHDNTHDEFIALHVHQRLPGIARRRTGGPRACSATCRAAKRPAPSRSGGSPT